MDYPLPLMRTNLVALTFPDCRNGIEVRLKPLRGPGTVQERLRKCLEALCTADSYLKCNVIKLFFFYIILKNYQK